MTLERLTEQKLPYCESTIDYDAVGSFINDKGVNEDQSIEQGRTIEAVIGTDKYTVDKSGTNTTLYNHLFVGAKGNIAMYDFAWVKYDVDANGTTDADEGKFVTRDAKPLENMVLDPSMLGVAFNTAELHSFIYNLIPIYDAEITALNTALKADGVKKTMTDDDKSAVVAEAKKEHPDLNMILHKMYDVSKLDEAVVKNLELTILHYDYLAEGLRLAGADGAEHKDANGDVFKLDDDTIAKAKALLFPTEPVFDNIATAEGDTALDMIKSEMELDADPAGAKTYIKELSALDDINPLTDADWNDPKKVAAYFNAIIKAVKAAGGDDVTDLKGKHAITEFKPGKNGNGKKVFLTDQLVDTKPGHGVVKINTGEAGVQKANFLVGSDGKVAGNEKETSPIRIIGKYLESLAAKYGIDLNDGDDLAKLGEMTAGAPVAEATADAVVEEPIVEAAPAIAAPTTVVIKFENSGFPDDVTPAGKKDKAGAAITKVYMKVFDNGKVGLYQEDARTGIMLEGDADGTAHLFANMAEYRAWSGNNSAEIKEVQKQVFEKVFAGFANTDVEYAKGKSDLTEAGKKELDKVVALIEANKDVVTDLNVYVRGYASYDKWEWNGTLSRERAEKAAAYVDAQLVIKGIAVKSVNPHMYTDAEVAMYKSADAPFYYHADNTQRRTEVTATWGDTKYDADKANPVTTASTTTTTAPAAGTITYARTGAAEAVTVKANGDAIVISVLGLNSADVEWVKPKMKNNTEATSASLKFDGSDPLSVTTKFTGNGLLGDKLKDSTSYTYSYVAKMKNGTYVRINVAFNKKS